MLRLLASLCLAFACAAAQAADISFVTGQTLSSTLRNDSAVKQGFSFTNLTGVDIVVTQLGRWCVSGNSQTHTLTIESGANGGASTVLTSVSLSMSGKTPGQFAYATLATPYTIPAGSVVYFMSSETNGGDYFYENDTQITTTGIGSSIYPTYIDATIHLLVGIGANKTYGPLSFKYSAPIISWSKVGSVYTCSPDQYSLNDCIANATDGVDSINLTPGTVTWGAAQTAVTLNKVVPINGLGAVTVNVSPSTFTYSNGGCLIVSAPTTVSGITFTQSGGAAATTAILVNVAGVRFTNLVYNGATGGSSGYFIYASGVGGLCDNSRIYTTLGNDEFFFSRGPTTAWASDAPLGTGTPFYFENCTLSGPGYTDANSNASAVFRFNTVNGTTKFDGHGLASNTPAQGFRSLEVYNNTWTYTGGSGWTAMELRGGKNMVFNNTAAHTSNGAAFYFTDYGYSAQWPNFGNVYQTPLNYPIGYQVGTGKYSTINATAIAAYQMVQVLTVGTTNFALIGGTNVVGAQFIATGPGTGTGTVTTTAANDSSYAWGNVKNGSAWPRAFHSPDAGAITLYRTQTGNPAATFSESTLIQSNRDFFSDAGFDTNTGASIGTTAAMNALTPSVTGYGFWVTDQGSWNTTIAPGTSGQLYRWTGSAWALYYTPYTYPHPLRSGALSPNPSTIASTSAAATTVTVVATTTTGGTGAISYNHAVNGAYAGWQASPSHTFTGLTPSTSYAFKVKAQDNATTTTESSVSNVSTTGTVPTVSSVAIPSAGTTTVLTLSASCTTGTGGIGGVTASASGGALTLTYSSGSGSGTYTFTNSRTVLSTETVTLSYAQPGNGIEATTGGADLASFSGRAVTNNSTQVAATVPTVSLITIPAAGTTTVLTLSQSATVGAGGSGGFTAVASGGALTLTYASGSPGTAYTLTNSRTVNAGETVQVTYVQPGNGIEGTTGGLDLASFSLRSVANGSTAGIPTTTPTPPAPDRQPKPKKKQ